MKNKNLLCLLIFLVLMSIIILPVSVDARQVVAGTNNVVLRNGTPEEAGLDPHKIQMIDDIVQKHIDNGIAPGAVVLVAKDGIIVKNQAYGYAQKYDMGKLLETPKPMTTDTIFDLASVTKIMATSQGIMKLVSEGKLDVKDKVSKYIPEFGKNGKEDVTIEDLLSHTSGLTPWAPTYYHVTNSDDELKYICDLPLVYETGTQRKYSDFSFMTLGFIIEKITGQKLNIYLQNEIYKKLNMKDTGFLPSDSLKGRIAATSWGNPFEYRMVQTGTPYKVEETGYFETFQNWRQYTLIGEANDGNCFYANGGVAGHAGLFSTAYDLAILGQTMLNGGSYGHVKIYDENVLNEFIQPNKFGYGFDFDIGNGSYMGALVPSTTFGHAGFTGTQVMFDKVNNIEVIILTNKQNNGLTAKGTYASSYALSKEISDTVYSACRISH